jgi:hypothetical protein
MMLSVPRTQTVLSPKGTGAVVAASGEGVAPPRLSQFVDHATVGPTFVSVALRVHSYWFAEVMYVAVSTSESLTTNEWRLRLCKAGNREIPSTYELSPQRVER